MLFKFGLPAAINGEGHIYRVIETIDHNEIRKARRGDRWGKIGISLLVVGFVLQFVSNHIPL